MPFIDTSTWYAAFFDSEKNHGRAKALLGQALDEKNPLHYSDYILSELLTLVRVRKGAAASNHVLEVLLGSEAELTRVSEKHFQTAIEIFSKYPKLSFTDAVSIAIMIEKGIPEIYSFDEDFDAVPRIVRVR